MFNYSGWVLRQLNKYIYQGFIVTWKETMQCTQPLILSMQFQKKEPKNFMISILTKSYQDILMNKITPPLKTISICIKSTSQPETKYNQSLLSSFSQYPKTHAPPIKYPSENQSMNTPPLALKIPLSLKAPNIKPSYKLKSPTLTRRRTLTMIAYFQRNLLEVQLWREILNDQ